MSKIVKSVLITGCSSGLGKVTALFLKNKGWDVYTTARRDENIEALRKEGFKCYKLDLNSSESIRLLVKNLLDETGGTLAALVNNAGYSQLGAIEDLSRDMLRSQFETIVFGVVELTNALIPVFRKQGYGKIVCITSSHNNGFAFPFLGAESSSKNALTAICNALRQELRGAGISVSMVCPGEFPSKLMTSAVENFSNRAHSIHRETYKKVCPFFLSSVQKGQVEIIAEAVVRLIEKKNPPPLIVVPFHARIHYWAHRILPVYFLDKLVFLKMKFIYKVI